MEGGVAMQHSTPQRFFHMPRFQINYQKGNYVNNAGANRQFNAQGVMNATTFDGKRLRKSVYRKTIDYNTSMIQMLENRIWQRDHRDRRALQPDSLYHSELVPPMAMLDNPMNAVTTKHVRTSTNKFKCPVFCVCWTPEGRRLVTGASSGEFTLWSGLTFNFETILQAHDSSVRAMQWSHNDQWLLTGDHGGYVKYWQSNMNNVKMYQAHKEPIRGLSFCPTDSKYTSCSDDGTVRVWDFQHCHEERVLRGHGSDVKCVDWHPQKGLIASGSKDSQQPIKLWDPRAGNSLATIHAHKSTVMDLHWNPNGNWLLTASRDHLVKLFDIRSMKEEMQTFKGHKKEATTIAWHPIHEGMFASGGSDGAILFWLVGTDKEVGGMDEAHDQIIWDLAWHPMGHILVSGSNDHSTKFWTRNRPGDHMRDKYNLNTLPVGMGEDVDYDDIQSIAKIPGMGLEYGVAEHLKPKPPEEAMPSIPGLDWKEEQQSAINRHHAMQQQQMASRRKHPQTHAVPKKFEQAWETNVNTPVVAVSPAPPEKAAPTPTEGRPPSLLDMNVHGPQNGPTTQETPSRLAGPAGLTSPTGGALTPSGHPPGAMGGPSHVGPNGEPGMDNRGYPPGNHHPGPRPLGPRLPGPRGRPGEPRPLFRGQEGPPPRQLRPRGGGGLLGDAPPSLMEPQEEEYYGEDDGSGYMEEYGGYEEEQGYEDETAEYYPEEEQYEEDYEQGYYPGPRHYEMGPGGGRGRPDYRGRGRPLRGRGGPPERGYRGSPNGPPRRGRGGYMHHDEDEQYDRRDRPPSRGGYMSQHGDPSEMGVGRKRTWEEGPGEEMGSYGPPRGRGGRGMPRGLMGGPPGRGGPPGGRGGPPPPGRGGLPRGRGLPPGRGGPPGRAGPPRGQWRGGRGY
ncbi:pre-mRNA 3' end processing protein WDR33 [Lingula anatina]|uniref:Pre-mRNA 3' end processing protein WDR33 n=1 Tax=Lingula anatina TaxID=7574 RepID=A0A1S3K0G2_LINAN|nr:pre-mRNA 3' end processing protein WDR33 [Lingula anatina]|eukprot:XP_013416027.1 pre-mRNA 3' end processing protein WDR33 [Lingula anatina]